MQSAEVLQKKEDWDLLFRLLRVSDPYLLFSYTAQEKDIVSLRNRITDILQEKENPDFWKEFLFFVTERIFSTTVRLRQNLDGERKKAERPFSPENPLVLLLERKNILEGFLSDLFDLLSEEA